MIGQNGKKQFRQINSIVEYEVFEHIVKLPQDAKYNLFGHVEE